MENLFFRRNRVPNLLLVFFTLKKRYYIVFLIKIFAVLFYVSSKYFDQSARRNRQCISLYIRIIFIPLFCKKLPLLTS